MSVAQFTGKLTLTGKEKLVKAHAGDITLPKIKYIGYGSGGVDEHDQVIESTGQETALRKELLRKEVEGHTYSARNSCEYLSKLTEAEAAGEYLSEIGLFDEEDDLVAYHTFMKKGKDGNMVFKFSMSEALYNIGETME